MKKLFPILLTCFVLVVFASAARAQWLEGDVYSFGEQRIRVPAPEGFTDTFGRINRVAGPYIAGESDSNITLAVHIPRETAEQLEADDDAPLDFCTRVTTPKAYLSIDVESDLFSRMVLGFSEAAPGMADPFNPEAIPNPSS